MTVRDKVTFLLFLVVVALMALPSIVPRAPAIEGVPFTSRQIVLATAPQSFPSDLCRQGSVAGAMETRALVQVQTNGIYYVLNAGATYPLTTNGALVGNVGDVIEVMFPAKFSAIRAATQAAGNAALSVTCFQ